MYERHKGMKEMIEKNDWRLQGQERYLIGEKFIFKKYQMKSEKWDHDHCEFCWKKFMETDDSNDEIINEGYSTVDNYRWICKECFNDFKEMFKLEIIN